MPKSVNSDRLKRLEFGLLVREARIKKGFTLKELSEELRVSEGYLSQIENGKALKLSYDLLAHISNLFEVPLEKLQAALNRDLLRHPSKFAEDYPRFTDVVLLGLAEMDKSSVRDAFDSVEKRLAFFGEEPRDIASRILLLISGKLRLDESPESGGRPLSHYLMPIDQVPLNWPRRKGGE